MKIKNRRVNHVKNPVGYRFERLRFTWIPEAAPDENINQVILRVSEQPDMAEPMITRALDATETACEIMDLNLKPRTRYYWTVTPYISADDPDGANQAADMSGEKPAFFETGKLSEPWDAYWLATKPGVKHSVTFSRKTRLDKRVISARAYIYGLGLYELYINHIKAGDEYLTPGYHCYDFINSYQTIDFTEQVQEIQKGAIQSELELSVALGNGWYQGRYMFDGGYENLYGDGLKLIAEFEIKYQTGETQKIITDQSWECESNEILDNGIYDGEIQDYGNAGNHVEYFVENVDNSRIKLIERDSAPVRIVERVKPEKLMITPSGDQILDFGQMITGWVKFQCHEPAGKEIRLQYGEWMQNGEFYRDNLRTAKAEFICHSAGILSEIRPRFTFYGFRYVKISGIARINIQDFTAERICSDCEITGNVQTGNAKINRLMANILASQRCNFLDIPTDCPQRDERMGWTGDIGIFADTACYQMDCAAFLDHFLSMTALEQDAQNGAVPFFAPTPKPKNSDQLQIPFLKMRTACAWGDAVTVTAWALYEHTRDKSLLRKEYPSMKNWVEYVKGRASQNQIPYLWQNDFQLGDWLALDSQDPNGFFGLTDTGFIASAYYYHSTWILAQSARILDYHQDAELYQQDLKNIQQAFYQNYINPDGSLTIQETQTACAVLLAFDLCPENLREFYAEKLKNFIKNNHNHLSTGFVGTPLLCPALSEYGQHDTACDLLLNPDYPGWLYEVNLGAVTIWERWNSVDADGLITSTGMNSLNHYAYGSIAAWIYRYLCGFRPCVDFKNTIIIQPLYCPDLQYLDADYRAPWGNYHVHWDDINGELSNLKLSVPYAGKAILKLNGEEKILTAGAYQF